MSPPSVQTDRQRRIDQMVMLLADTLAEDFDLTDVLHQLTHVCVDLLGASAAGVLLGTVGDQLEVVASSDENSHLLDVLQLEAQSGPCLDAYTSGLPVVVTDLEYAQDRWPDFTRRARALGFRSVHAIPMRLRADVIGVVNMVHEKPIAFAPDDARVAQALADIATISVFQLRRLHEREQVAAQLQLALNSRIVIEQAKGMLAEVGHLNMGRAFDALRRYARDNNLRLSLVADQVVNRQLDAAEVLDHSRLH